MTSVALAIATSAFLLSSVNNSFWGRARDAFAGHPWEFVAFATALLLLGVALLVTFSVKYLTKPLFILLILIAAAASYFNDAFGILITRDMIQNAAVTTTSEASNLLTPNLFRHLFLFGLLPSLVVVWVKVEHKRFGAKFLQNSIIVFSCLIGAVVLVGWNYASFASVIRQRPDMMASINPAAPIVGAGKYLQSVFKEKNVVVQPLGTDAKQGNRFASVARKGLTVVVVGETARAQNFSLNGYERNTNPELAQRGVFAFTDTSSCGTATAVSLPCMFSIYPRSDYSEYKALSTQNLTDVLSHAGVDVHWWDNNTGSKGVADRVDYAFLPKTADPRFCSEGECHDDILVDRLKTFLDNEGGAQNTVLVLHQIGSHGPAYFERYPKAFSTFTPECKSTEFTECSRDEIVNAYDNTIVYTDHVLAEIIDLLKAHSDEYAASMIYMSDHGESLGENGLYLHGAPYFMAPSTQTHVPFVAWISDSATQAMKLDTACLRDAGGNSYSHDNLFHTVLGLADVATSVYDPALDAFAPCRAAAVPLASQNESGSRS